MIHRVIRCNDKDDAASISMLFQTLKKLRLLRDCGMGWPDINNPPLYWSVFAETDV